MPRSVALLLTVPVPRAVGGGERYVQELARALDRHVSTELHVLGAPHGAGWEQATAHRFRYPRLRDPRFALSPGAWRAAAAADVVHLLHFGTIGTYATAVLARARGRRVFATDLGVEGYDLATRTGLDRLFHGFLEISEFAARVTPARRTRVIYGGVDTERFRPGDKAADPYALFVGRLLPHKGLDWLIGATPPGVRLVICGRPDEAGHPGYVDRLRGLAAGKDVEWVFDASDARIAELYREAAAICLTSVHRSSDGWHHTSPELLGLTALEGMASGTPAIVSDVTSLPEIVRPGETGTIVAEGDEAALGAALRAYTSEPERARREGAAARAEVERRFTWERTAARCLDAYGELSTRS